MKNSRSKMGRVEKAEKLAVDMGKLFTANVEGKYSPIEMISNYCSMYMIFLREIMMNTAIIADHINKLNTLEYPNIEKGEFNE